MADTENPGGGDMPPGFYLDQMTGLERWWDGERFTDSFAEERRGATEAETAESPQLSAPGIYFDQASGQERWWDGNRFAGDEERGEMEGDTDEFLAADVHALEPQQQRPRSGGREHIRAGRPPSKTDRSILSLLFAGVGLAAVIAGAVMPEADTESSLHIAKNSMIQHGEGALVIGVALLGFVSAFKPGTGWRLLAIAVGGAVVALAAVAGSHLNDLIQYRNELSRAVAGNVSAGTGIWVIGVGGLLLAISGFMGEWEPSDEYDDDHSASGGPPTSDEGMAVELARLNDLRLSGALSEAEFAQAKRKLIETR